MSSTLLILLTDSARLVPGPRNKLTRLDWFFVGSLNFLLTTTKWCVQALMTMKPVDLRMYTNVVRKRKPRICYGCHLYCWWNHWIRQD